MASSKGNIPWSTPFDAPLAPPFPFTFRSVETLTLVYRTTEQAIARLLPEPLKPISDRVLVHIYNMGDVDYLGSYGECNVMIGAEAPGGLRGGFSPFLFLNSDGGLAQGREVHGQPKKFANPRVEFRQDLVVGIVERNGIECCTGTMAYKQRRGNLEDLKREAFDFSVNLNYKILREITGEPAVCQITSRKLADMKLEECWRGPCTVELRPNAQAPLHRLPVVEELDGYHWKGSFTLVPGTVVHDYLK
jgi:acetoacetate decarboxylase